jgi:hypothetical protein
MDAGKDLSRKENEYGMARLLRKNGNHFFAYAQTYLLLDPIKQEAFSESHYFGHFLTQNLKKVRSLRSHSLNQMKRTLTTISNRHWSLRGLARGGMEGNRDWSRSSVR